MSRTLIALGPEIRKWNQVFFWPADLKSETAYNRYFVYYYFLLAAQSLVWQDWCYHYQSQTRWVSFCCATDWISIYSCETFVIGEGTEIMSVLALSM